MTRPSCLLTVLRAVVTALLVLSGSIAVPILCRFFYYLHIGPLGLVEQTGLSADQIRQAYNEMMDFCSGTPCVTAIGNPDREMQFLQANAFTARYYRIYCLHFSTKSRNQRLVGAS